MLRNLREAASLAAPLALGQHEGGGRQRETLRRCICVVGFKPNSTCDHCWQEKRTEGFSNQLSKEGPRKEIAAAVSYSRGFSLLRTSVTACSTQWQGTFCFLFVAAWRKRKASGGTRPAGLDVYRNLKLQFQLRRSRPAAGLLSLLDPKKVTKERAWLSPDFCREGDQIDAPMLLN